MAENGEELKERKDTVWEFPPHLCRGGLSSGMFYAIYEFFGVKERLDMRTSHCSQPPPCVLVCDCFPSRDMVIDYPTPLPRWGVGG